MTCQTLVILTIPRLKRKMKFQQMWIFQNKGPIQSVNTTLGNITLYYVTTDVIRVIWTCFATWQVLVILTTPRLKRKLKFQQMWIFQTKDPIQSVNTTVGNIASYYVTMDVNRVIWACFATCQILVILTTPRLKPKMKFLQIWIFQTKAQFKAWSPLWSILHHITSLWT